MLLTRGPELNSGGSRLAAGDLAGSIRLVGIRFAFAPREAGPINLICCCRRSCLFSCAFSLSRFVYQLVSLELLLLHCSPFRKLQLINWLAAKRCLLHCNRPIFARKFRFAASFRAGIWPCAREAGTIATIDHFGTGIVFNAGILNLANGFGRPLEIGKLL